MGGPQCRYERRGEEKKFYPSGTRTPKLSVAQPVVSIPTAARNYCGDNNDLLINYVTFFSEEPLMQ
jgi:hypothetical protein